MTGDMAPVSRRLEARTVELVKYGAGSLLMLAFKLGLMQLFLLFSRELVAYCLVQIFVFFGSYLWHSKVTFRIGLSWRRMVEYLKTIIVFLGLDYFVFAVIFTRYLIASTYVIFMATGVVFMLRFVFVRRSLQGTTTAKAGRAS
jgi:hypothetical protein